MHLAADGSEVAFHSSRSCGKGEYDIWVRIEEIVCRIHKPYEHFSCFTKHTKGFYPDGAHIRDEDVVNRMDDGVEAVVAKR